MTPPRPKRAGGRWSLLRWVSRGLGIAGVILAVVTVRVVTESRAELQRGDRRADAGEPDAAVVHYRRAAGWHAPANPYCSMALDRLATMADEAEAAGDRDRALAANRAIRGGILAGRSFYTPHASRLAAADEKIAGAMAALEATTAGAGVERSRLHDDHLALLRERPDPSPGWLAVLLLGMLGWVGGAFAFARTAFDGEDRLVARAARIWGTVVIVGLGLWVLGMTLA